MGTLLEICTRAPATSGAAEDGDEEKIGKVGVFFKVLGWLGRVDRVGLGRGAAAPAALPSCLPKVSLKL